MIYPKLSTKIVPLRDDRTRWLLDEVVSNGPIKIVTSVSVSHAHLKVNAMFECQDISRTLVVIDYIG